MESANYLISIFRLISRGLAVGVGCAREGPRCGVGQCWTVSDIFSPHPVLTTSSEQGDYDGSGQQSCKCNYVDFSK